MKKALGLTLSLIVSMGLVACNMGVSENGVSSQSVEQQLNSLPSSSESMEDSPRWPCVEVEGLPVLGFSFEEYQTAWNTKYPAEPLMDITVEGKPETSLYMQSQIKLSSRNSAEYLPYFSYGHFKDPPLGFSLGLVVYAAQDLDEHYQMETIKKWARIIADTELLPDDEFYAPFLDNSRRMLTLLFPDLSRDQCDSLLVDIISQAAGTSFEKDPLEAMFGNPKCYMENTEQMRSQGPFITYEGYEFQFAPLEGGLVLKTRPAISD